MVFHLNGYPLHPDECNDDEQMRDLESATVPFTKIDVHGTNMLPSSTERTFERAAICP